MKTLVGCTGFVGTNLWASGMFDKGYHSTDITQAYGTKPELLVYSGLRAEKFLANQNPQKDSESILEAQHNIEKIQPKRIVFISTIDVFAHPVGVNEATSIQTSNLHPYGLHRFQMECWIKEYDPNAVILRLPGLYGANLKKNFIYDCIQYVPSMLKETKFMELLQKDSSLLSYYTLLDNGFYQLNPLTPCEKKNVRALFETLHFNALHFTDSRSVFQFYPLKRLAGDIEICLREGINVFHPATEPISSAELYHFVYGQSFENELSGIPANYDYHTQYADIFGGENDYIMNKQTILSDIKQFIEEAGE